MITTDSNKRNQNLGETRTFSVQNHSAEGLKNDINSKNESTLAEKNRAIPERARANSSQSSNANANAVRRTVSQGNGEVRRVNNSAQSQRRVAQNTTRATNSTATAQNRTQTQRPVSRPRPSTSSTTDPVRRTGAARNAQQSVRPEQNEVRAVAERKKEVAVKAENQTALTPRTEKKPVVKAEKAPTVTKTQPTYNNAKKESHYESSDEGGNTVISIVKAIVYIIFIIIFSVFLSLGIILVGNDVFAFVKSDEVVEVTIPEYATLDQVTDILYENDIIKYPSIFKLFAVYKQYDGEFLAGTYSVNGMMNYEALLEEFKEKIVYATVDVTIPEGFTTDEIIDLFVEQYGIGTREGFVDVIQNYDFNYWFIDELEENGRMENRIYRLDGYLFPDTYQFYTSSSEVTVINKLLKRFSQIFTKEYRNQCEAFGYSVDEMITLASMIEREAASPSEFFLVSSVFHNRLNNKWNFPRLESDATVLYVLRHESGEKVSVTAEDLKYDTPYNTYLYEGLPPGPIANPSASAMLAALSPQTTNYYYFVANKGTTYFSETKAQHDAYINEFKNETAEQQTTGDMPQN